MKKISSYKKVNEPTLYINLVDETPEIKTLYHISDIHISKNTTRYNEYQKVFNKLIEKIQNDIMGQSLIVITGDIVHEKSVMSTDQVLFIKNFLIRLSQLCPLILILGNHDLNPNNTNIDAISPLLKNLKTANPIHLLLDNAVYIYGNLAFGLTTMDTHTVTQCFDENRIKIGLYHGTISGAVTDMGYKLTNSSDTSFRPIDFMKYYDITLLGDVHKFSYMNKEQSIAYGGSLIQQDINEDPYQHGMIRWDLSNPQHLTNQFIQIPNEHAMIRVDVTSDGLSMFDRTIIPQYCTFYLFYNGISYTNAIEWANYLKTQYPHSKTLLQCIRNVDDCEITFGSHITEQNESTEHNDPINSHATRPIERMRDIRSNHDIKQIMLNFASQTDRYKQLDQETKLKIEIELDQMISENQYDYSSTTKHFTLQSLKFGNYFVYDVNNEINFCNLTGVIGIEGKSGSGKSTLIDCLLYAIFGQPLRGDKSDIVRSGKKLMNTIVRFTVNNNQYKVVRRRTRSGVTKIKTNERLKLFENNIDVTCDTVDLTNQQIGRIVGSCENFIDVSVVLQKDCMNYVDLSQGGRRDMICKILRLNVFNQIIANCRNKLAQLSKDLNKITTNDAMIQNTGRKKTHVFDPTEQIKLIDHEIMINERIIENRLKAMNRLKKELVRKNEQFIEQRLKLANYDKVAEDKKKIVKIKKSIEDLSKQMIQIDQKLEQTTTSRNKQLIELEQLEKVDHQKANKQNQLFEQDKKIIISQLTDRLEKLFGSKLPINKKNNSKDVEKMKTTEMIRGQKIINEIKCLNDEINSLPIVPNKLNKITEENYLKLIDMREKHSMMSDKLEQTIQTNVKVEKRLEKLSNHQYDPNCKYCMAFDRTLDLIMYEKEYLTNTQTIASLQNEIQSLSVMLSGLEKYEKFHNRYVETEKTNQTNQKLIDLLKCKIEGLEKDHQLSCVMLKQYEEQISEITKNKLNMEENQKIDKECDELKIQIAQKERQINPSYVKYLQISKQTDQLTKSIAEIDFVIRGLVFEKSQLDAQLKIMNSDYEKLEVDGKLLEERDELVGSQKTLHNEIKELEDMIKNKMDEKKQADDQLIRLSIQKDTENNMINNYNKLIEMKSSYQSIVDIFGNNDSLINHILQKHVFPELEKNVNQILKKIANYSIRLSCCSKGCSIMKRLQNGTELNISTISGGESYMTNLAFRLALSEYNNFIKTDFLIIDEAFIYFDESTVDRIPLVFEYIRSKFKWAIVISHDQRICKSLDQTYYVAKSKNNRSRILIN